MTLQKLGDPRCGNAHQGNRQDQTKDQHSGMFARRAGNGQDIVKRHRHVRDNDLPGRLREGLSWPAPGDQTVGVPVFAGQRLGGAIFVGGMAAAQLAPHFPAHPKQKDTTGKKQAGDRQKLGGADRKDNPQHGSGGDAHQNRLGALFLGQARRGKTDDDGIVTCKHQINADDLHQCGKASGRENFHSEPRRTGLQAMLAYLGSRTAEFNHASTSPLAANRTRVALTSQSLGVASSTQAQNGSAPCTPHPPFRKLGPVVIPCGMFAKLLSSLLAPAPLPLPAPQARLALGALLIRVAKADGHYAGAEVARIDRVLAARYDLAPFEAGLLRQKAEALEAEAPDTVRFTRALKDAVPLEDRRGLMAALWSVALADGGREAGEDAVIRLVASLLGITDRDSALARQQVEKEEK